MNDYRITDSMGDVTVTAIDEKDALMEIPRCPEHGEPMAYRPAGTPEQAFCGTWYDCHHPGCTCSVLIPSRELAEMYAKAGKPIYHPSLSPNVAQ